jgi:hypothetical protein
MIHLIRGLGLMDILVNDPCESEHGVFDELYLAYKYAFIFSPCFNFPKSMHNLLLIRGNLAY